MPMELEKAAPVSLRSLGLDERWLQDRINEDPSVLGLGNLEIAGKEHRQPVGGRIDFLLRDTEGDDTYYEVEVMLGALDESHIIRTIEYWDVERQRRPNSNHRAVIVAEQITTRFFNVIRLLNRSVPLIAIKLSAFSMNGRVVLHPVTVLDVIEESSEELDVEERTDRAYWGTKSPSLLSILDKVVSSLRAAHIEPRLTYNRHHVALGTTGRNFCWFYPRKSPETCNIEFRVVADRRDALVSGLQEIGISASPQRTELGTFNITMSKLQEHLASIIDMLKNAEEASRS
jgi:hypothetical protein